MYDRLGSSTNRRFRVPPQETRGALASTVDVRMSDAGTVCHVCTGRKTVDGRFRLGPLLEVSARLE